MQGKELVECPGCRNQFEFQEAGIDYTAKDDKGITVSKQTAEHMAKYRVRCAHCKENFCVECKMLPYHINYNCQEA